MTKWVYLFEEGSADMRNLLGGKGYSDNRGVYRLLQSG